MMTARRLTRVEQEAIYASRARPRTWRFPQSAYQPRSVEKLDLTETVIVRRLATGASGRAIGRAMGRNPTTINEIIKKMMERHGVKTREELLALPIVQAALDGE